MAREPSDEARDGYERVQSATLRSYDASCQHHDQSDPSASSKEISASLDISDAGRATASAPRYFPAVRLEAHPNKSFVDGAVVSGLNNPSVATISETRTRIKEFKRENLPMRDSHLHTFVSIGTGTKPRHIGKSKSWKEFWSLKRWVIDPEVGKLGKAFVQTGFDCNESWKKAEKKLRDVGTEIQPPVLKYYRFGGKDAQLSVKLDEFRKPKVDQRKYPNQPARSPTLRKIEKAARKHLETPEVSRSLDELAFRLVEHRRARARHSPSEAKRFYAGEYGD